MKNKIELACRTADDFTRLYYKHFDKMRTQINRLYLDSGLLVWNGNGVNGKDNIQKYIVELPTTEHYCSVLDAQPITDDTVTGQTTILIQTGGTVKYTDHPQKPFQQTFVITAEGDKWKIVSDCYRLQDALQISKENAK